MFGLPGNPVAALVSFYQLIIPAIHKLSGHNHKEVFMPVAKLSADLKKKHGRLEFVRGVISTNRLGELIVSPTKGQGSHMLSGIAKANCLIHFPKQEDFIRKGSNVKVELLRWDI